jgi:hypothetical protein
MTAYQAELSINLGDVGYRDSKQPFRVRLNASALSELIGHAENAHRVYELMMIDRPGDVWGYVSVVIEDVPSRLMERIESARKDAKPRYAKNHPWPEQSIPFTAFDGLFYWCWDDTEPEDEAWLTLRDGPTMRAFAQQLLATARAARAALDWGDPLLRHIVARVRSGDHPYSYLRRQVAMQMGNEHGPTESKHTASFYSKLDDLLRDSELVSVAYRADGDYRVLRMMATEQRRRANRTGHNAGIAMHLSALVNHKFSNEAWDSEIWFFSEGLAHGDLYVEGGGLGSNTIKVLVEQYGHVPGRYILSTKDEGSIDGFDSESGDGWVLYQRKLPDDRRRALERIAGRRHCPLGPVLLFAEKAASLFDYEKTVVVVGEETETSVREALAPAMAEWQNNGGDPLLIIMGDTKPFEMTS